MAKTSETATKLNNIANTYGLTENVECSKKLEIIKKRDIQSQFRWGRYWLKIAGKKQSHYEVTC